MINLTSAASNPKKFASGTHSLIGKLKNITIKGITIPPPPIPAALASIVMKDSITIPNISLAFKGNSNGVNRDSSLVVFILVCDGSL
jgi:hypothetical protein